MARIFLAPLGRASVLALGAALALAACAAEESAPPEPVPEAAEPAAPAPEPEPAAPSRASGPRELPNGIVLALAQFVREEGEGGEMRVKPGAARLEFLFLRDGRWQTSSVEDPESNVFHKAMVFEGAEGPALLTLGGSEAVVKSWSRGAAGVEARTLWRRDFGGKFSRMRDAEAADLYGEGVPALAVATHDQGVVAVLRPTGDGGFDVVELDQEPDTFVHEIEIGDLDADGTLEVYATPSEPNRLDGTPQSGEVVRYVPAEETPRAVVADLGDRHAKEILVADVDGDGRDELYVSVEGHVDEQTKQLTDAVEIRRYEADTPPDQGALIATIPDRLCRFLTVGDIEGDGQRELVAAAFSSGVWLLRPGEDPNSAWDKKLVDADSSGFEHAAILTDLDEDGRDELYVASDRDKEVRRYVWNGSRLERETIYVRPPGGSVFTWNLMPVPVELIP